MKNLVVLTTLLFCFLGSSTLNAQKKAPVIPIDSTTYLTDSTSYELSGLIPDDTTVHKVVWFTLNDSVVGLPFFSNPFKVNEFHVFFASRMEEVRVKETIVWEVRVMETKVWFLGRIRRKPAGSSIRTLKGSSMSYIHLPWN
jgi:hypothetical protein